MIGFQSQTQQLTTNFEFIMHRSGKSQHDFILIYSNSTWFKNRIPRCLKNNSDELEIQSGTLSKIIFKDLITSMTQL